MCGCGKQGSKADTKGFAGLAPVAPGPSALPAPQRQLCQGGWSLSAGVPGKVLEYLTAEILELVRNMAQDKKKACVTYNSQKWK
ncbi:hypothetical protein J1605_017545 [Eschrichtius robustus]|uniref:Uncharacterized protein n=1 Tax=Eschrichtius robustus TaxID=9764 RepID=A0AB34I265_ESCRO|nr:hypothetical protein J1605_017545 [Eschrichtius robustus]